MKYRLHFVGNEDYAMTNSNIPPQLHVGRIKPTKEFIRPIMNQETGKKPWGGLWTSTFLGEEAGSGWVQNCLKNEIFIPEGGMWSSWLLTPSKQAKIFIIDGPEDADTLYEKYGYYPFGEPVIPLLGEGMKGINFEKMKEEWDAVHLTFKGFGTTRCRFDNFSHELYGWDSESTVWFRFLFEEVKELGEIKYTKVEW